MTIRIRRLGGALGRGNTARRLDGAATRTPAPSVARFRPLKAVRTLARVAPALIGCAIHRKRHAVPSPLIDSVHVVDMKGDIRMWGDRKTEAFQRSLAESARQAGLTYGIDAPVSVLAISGGGSNGAFAAGLLCGWTVHGTRPEFRVVSGVSVGAIVAPFAFLGSKYDDLLREMTFSATDNNAFRKKLPTAVLTGGSLADNDPLRHYLGRYVDGDLLRSIAAEHVKGRRLYVATTNLDACRPVYWDMGAIASSGSPRALRLFQEVILASTAAPVFYPPSYIEVEHEGKTYDEMHVDGGVTGQILLYGQALTTQEVVPDAPKRHATYYIIRNGRLSRDYEPVEPRIGSIALRSFNRLNQAQAVGDLWQAYATCWRDAMDFRLAAIPDDVPLRARGIFDAQTVGELFDRGYALAHDGYPWAAKPPGVYRFDLPPLAEPPDAHAGGNHDG